VCMYDDESDARDVQSSSSSRPQLRSALPQQTLDVVGQEAEPRRLVMVVRCVF
jgi:hypothetical protein